MSEMKAHEAPQNLKQPGRQRFIAARLGPEGDELSRVKIMLARSFGAGSFHEFWHYWNPVYAYYLYYTCYRPLKKRFPHWLCALLTFGASGFFLHDLPFGWGIRAVFSFLKGETLPFPFVTVWFVLMGLLHLLSRIMNADYSKRHPAFRTAANSLCIIAPLLLSLAIERCCAR